jgi:hypothetical protein
VRVKALYTARISRNWERIALEKSAFESWSATKKQETVSMREAVSLLRENGCPRTGCRSAGKCRCGRRQASVTK